ncbi:MAG TPA: methylamine utilization protein MauJ [Candidatus Limnocylindria bacterium]|nr:methylamine utilization protein MauJ [Candidatus Limnocylindria bacterium]
MQKGLPTVTAQQIVDEAFPYLGRGSYFQTTAYDTHLFISGSDEYDIFHHFELFGRKILWVNQVQDEVMGELRAIMPRTIFQCDPNNFDGHIVAHRLASVLCYVTHGTFINPRHWVGIAHPAPGTSQPAEKYVSMHYGHDQIDMGIQRLDLDTFTEKRWAALAHYRQASLAVTPYYRVLSYWKVIELYFGNANTPMNTYINDLYASRPDIFHELGTFTGTASRKLRNIRHASAHFMLDGDTAIQDPDNPDVYNEVSNGLFALRRLAEGLIDRTTGW